MCQDSDADLTFSDASQELVLTKYSAHSVWTIIKKGIFDISDSSLMICFERQG